MIKFATTWKGLALLAVVLMQSCASSYQAPDLAQRKRHHREVAIIPFEVKYTGAIAAEDLASEGQELGYQAQQLCYTQFTQSADKYSVNFQDVTRTNELLAEAGLSYQDLFRLSKYELADILRVDAIIVGNITREQPAGSDIMVDLNIYDGVDSSLMWKLEKSLSGASAATAEAITDALFERIPREFPYISVQP